MSGRDISSTAIRPEQHGGFAAACDSQETARENAQAWVCRVIVVLLVGFPFCLIWQGLDVTDTGYYLVNCQQFFHAYPHDFGDAQCTAYWLTNLIGACWYKLTGDCGLIGFRMLYLLVIYLTVALVYVAMRDFCSKHSKEKMLLVLLAAEAFCIASGNHIPSYNQLTSLLFIATAISLYFGLVRRRDVWIIVAGLIAALSVFARIVNVPILAIIAGVWYYHFIQIGSYSAQNILLSFRNSLAGVAKFGAGFIAGILLILALAATLGHLGALHDMFVGLFHMGAGGKGKGTHGFMVLLKGLAWDYIHIGICGICFVTAAGLLSLAATRTGPSFRRIWIGLWALALALILFKWPILSVWLIPAMIYAPLVMGVGMPGCSRELRLLCVLTAIVSFVIPFGSVDGVVLSLQVVPLAFPTAVTVLFAAVALFKGNSNELSKTPSQPLGISPSSVSSGSNAKANFRCAIPPACVDYGAVAWASIFGLIIFSAAYSAAWTYRDSPDRFALRAVVKHPKLRAVFTTASRAKAMEELLEELQPLVRKDDYLLDHMQFPMLYFLTETRPYLYSSWANVYDPPMFQEMLDRALSTRPSLPVCVMTKVDTSHPKWPDETYPLLPYYRHVENRRIIMAFLESHHYEKRWENNAFAIWVAP